MIGKNANNAGNKNTQENSTPVPTSFCFPLIFMHLEFFIDFVFPRGLIENYSSMTFPYLDIYNAISGCFQYSKDIFLANLKNISLNRISIKRKDQRLGSQIILMVRLQKF